MTRLNLLPWRDLRRQELNNQVRNIAIAVALAMAGLVFWGYTYMNGQIDFQNQRNAYLQKEIKKVEKTLKEINTIRKKRAALLARMDVIQKLQSDRTKMVKVFDGLAKHLPKGLYLTLFSINGSKIKISGTADSNGTVSKFMRMIESSDEFSTPTLHIIRVTQGGGLRVSNFTINVNVIKTKKKKPADASSSSSNKGGK